MSDAIALICAIGIVGPILVVLVVVYNVSRQLKGLPEEEGYDALMDIWKKLIGQDPKLKNVPQSGISPSAEKTKETENKTIAKSNNVEDAEFYEKKTT